MNLSGLAGKRVAIVLTIEGERRILSGKARYEREPALGNVLRIPVEEAGARVGRAEFVIQESQWDGHVVPDEVHGCDYCLFVTEKQLKTVLK